jgi:hypothetical protein
MLGKDSSGLANSINPYAAEKFWEPTILSAGGQ